MQTSIIKTKSIEFSLLIIELYKKLKEEREYIISSQLLRSATSMGANVYEAGAAQSRPDFFSKMSIASKEARETEYWLTILDHSRITQIDIINYMTKLIEKKRILTSIVKTTSESLKRKKVDGAPPS